MRLLEGLSEEIQSKVFEYCSEKKWRMLEHDVETTEPDFEEVKEVVLGKAKMLERRKLFIGGRAMGSGYAGIGEPGTPVPSVTASTIPTTVTSPAPAPSDSMGELAKQISRLTLILEGQPRTQSVPSGNSPNLMAQRQWEPRCIWCDSVEHIQRGKCGELREALDNGLVGFNEKGRIKLMSTGEELPTKYGRGGMKEVLSSRMPTTSTTSSVTMNTADATAITFDDRVFGSLGNQDGSARVTLLDFENGIRTDQIIDVEANEKRKRGAADQTRRVRTRMDSQKDDSQKDDSQTAQNTHDTAQSKKSAAPAPVSVEDVPDEETPGGEHSTQTSQTSPPDIAGAKPKFRLGSELNKSITVESIGEKVMEAPIQLKMCELLAVSIEVANYLHDQT